MSVTRPDSNLRPIACYALMLRPPLRFSCLEGVFWTQDLILEKFYSLNLINFEIFYGKWTVMNTPEDQYLHRVKHHASCAWQSLSRYQNWKIRSKLQCHYKNNYIWHLTSDSIAIESAWHRRLQGKNYVYQSNCKDNWSIWKVVG